MIVDESMEKGRPVADDTTTQHELDVANEDKHSLVNYAQSSRLVGPPWEPVTGIGLRFGALSHAEPLKGAVGAGQNLGLGVGCVDGTSPRSGCSHGLEE